jgi:N-methylhydantoinase B/oxoprolinase/acetone carboxylase alpha subunit
MRKRSDEVAHDYNAPIAPGDRIEISLQAGRGWGPPDERDPHMVKEDLLDGFIPPEQAQFAYGLKRQSAPVAFPSSNPKQRPL